MRANVQGNNLVITGEGFDKGAVVLLGGVEQKTQNDKVHPGAVLIIRKAGKKISTGETVTLQVRNNDGSLSEQFIFIREN